MIYILQERYLDAACAECHAVEIMIYQHEDWMGNEPDLHAKLTWEGDLTIWQAEYLDARLWPELAECMGVAIRDARTKITMWDGD
jgi:hypothetical protein